MIPKENTYQIPLEPLPSTTSNNAADGTWFKGLPELVGAAIATWAISKLTGKKLGGSLLVLYFVVVFPTFIYFEFKTLRSIYRLYVTKREEEGKNQRLGISRL